MMKRKLLPHDQFESKYTKVHKPSAAFNEEVWTIIEPIIGTYISMIDYCMLSLTNKYFKYYIKELMHKIKILSPYLSFFSYQIRIISIMDCIKYGNIDLAEELSATFKLIDDGNCCPDFEGIFFNFIMYGKFEDKAYDEKKVERLYTLIMTNMKRRILLNDIDELYIRANIIPEHLTSIFAAKILKYCRIDNMTVDILKKINDLIPLKVNIDYILNKTKITCSYTFHMPEKYRSNFWIHNIPDTHNAIIRSSSIAENVDRYYIARTDD